MKTLPLSVDSKLNKFIPSIVGFLISLLFAYYAISTPINERLIDWKVYDFYASNYPQIDANNSIVIIDIDDQSLESIGQWPWPRYRLAEALRMILEGQPSTVLVDILFSEKDRSSLVNIQDLFTSEFAVNLDFASVPKGLTDNDAYLSHVIDGAPVVLPLMLTQNEVLKQDNCINSHVKQANENLVKPKVQQYQDVICPLEMFYQSSAATGFTNAVIDKDGLVRRMPILKEYKGKLIPSLSLAALTVLLGADFEVKSSHDGNLVVLNNYQIPIDDEGNALLNFREKSRHYQTIPMLKLMSGAVSADYFKGKIVLVGATASALNSIVNTSLDPVFPLIEAQATLLDNVLNNRVLTIPAWFEQLEVLSIILLGLIISLLMARKTVLASNISIVLLLSILVISPAVILYNYQFYLSPFLTIVSLISIFIIVTIIKHYIAEKHLLSVQNSISKANHSIIDSMATVAELRDSETGGHIVRTRLYVKTLIEHLQTKEKFRHQINEDYIKFICAAAPLHDIGKVGIPDHILLKPGRLTAEELVVMRTHAALGGDILKQTIKKVGENPYLNIAIEIANYHHEKWDGSGYPLALKGEEIPLSARIMAISDVFDALINKRIYKAAFSFEDTLKYIKQNSGTHFEPDIVDAFFEIKEELLQIATTIDD